VNNTGTKKDRII